MTFDTSEIAIPSLNQKAGSALFWGKSESGWDHPPLFLGDPVLLMKVTAVGTQVMTPAGKVIAESEDSGNTPFQWITEILEALTDSVSTSSRRLFMRPRFPIATMAMSYEYGRYFSPHQDCFSHFRQQRGEDLFVAFHCTGYALVEGRWKMVGRPPSTKTRWRDWQIPREQADWPRPMRPAKSHLTVTEEFTLDEDQAPHIPRPEIDFETYQKRIAKIKHHLMEGDIYQANLTTRFTARTASSAENIFEQGIRLGGERYSCLMRTSSAYQISFSPELLLRRWGNQIMTKPIKGTVKWSGEKEDRAQGEVRLRTEKNNAEHVMIVDLERNDFGRLCSYGSIRVDPLMQCNEHDKIMHLESTVSGTLKQNTKFRELFSALFPGGSVTGAPKKRALEIISELESSPRGIYCGAMGWVDSYGDCELNLPIRTASLYDDHRLHLHAGGGIVADSDAREEWDELHDKIAFFSEALQTASLVQE